jgi:hypothetical protein
MPNRSYARKGLITNSPHHSCRTRKRPPGQQQRHWQPHVHPTLSTPARTMVTGIVYSKFVLDYCVVLGVYRKWQSERFLGSENPLLKLVRI